MKYPADIQFFTKAASALLLCAFCGVVLLTGCDSGNSKTPTFTPATPPGGGSGGGPVSSGGGSSPVQIGNKRSSDYTLSAPQIALNDSDAAIVAWQEEYSSSTSVWVNLYTNGHWGSVPNGPVDTDAVDPRVAIDPNGGAIMAWTKKTFDATSALDNSAIWVRRYANGSWEQAVRVSAAPVTGLYAFAPALAIDINGIAMAVWTQDEPPPATRSTWAARFDGSAWGAPFILSSGSRKTYEARVAADAMGHFIAVWTEDTNAYDPGKPAGNAIPNVWARRNTNGTWSGGAMIGDATLATNDGTARPSISMNADGTAAVAWEQRKGGVTSIAVNRYDALTGLWGTTPVVINTATTASPSAWPAIALDPAGNAIAVWQQSDGSANNAWASHSGIASNWGTPQRLGTQGIEVQNLRADVDAAGNALAVWQTNPLGAVNPVVKARRYLLATGWESGSATLNITGQDLALDVNSGGKALVVANRATSGTLGFLSAPWALLYQP
jgi:hypothetical protein